MSNPQKQNPPARVGFANVGFGESRQRDHTGTPPDVNTLLSRLDRVKASGKGWIARCPAHEDRNASMSVAIGDDGRLLVHCFAGCSIGDVLGAMGLSVGDLFPARIRDTSTAGRREASEFARQAQWRAALNVLAFEATIIVIAARELREGKPLATDDDARLILACERVIDAKAVLS